MKKDVHKSCNSQFDKGNRYESLIDKMEGQIQIIEDLGKMHVSNTRHNGKEIVHEMTSR